MTNASASPQYQPGSRQQGLRSDRSRERNSLPRYPLGTLQDRLDLQANHRLPLMQSGLSCSGENCGNTLSGESLPDIPQVVNWATVSFILSMIPWLLVFADHIFSTPAVPSADLPTNSYGAMLLGIGYLMLAVSVLNGHKWTRVTITAGSVLVDFFMLARMAITDRYLGLVGEWEAGITNFMMSLCAWTVVLSSIGLVLLYTPASNRYIAQSEAYKAYIDQQNAGYSPRWRLARPGA